MESLLRDLRLAVRGLGKGSAFTVAAALTLAIGIGASTAIFSAVDAILIHPLPYRDQDRLVAMWQTDVAKGTPFIELSYPEYEAWRDGARSFSGLAAMTSTNFRVNLTGKDEPVQVEGAAVSASFFDVLGVKPLLGRVFGPDDDRPNAAAVVMLGHGLWQRRFAGNPAIVGGALTVDGSAVTVVGILPPGVSFPKGAEVWFPSGPTLGTGDPRRYRILEVVARMKAGVTLLQAQAEMDVVAKRVESTKDLKDEGLGVKVASLPALLYGDTRPALVLLLAAVGFLLLIACANVANLLLARAADREREMALRSALGASRRRLVSQLLAESFALALLGGSLGVLLAAWGVSTLAAGIPADVPGADHVALDGRALAFALVASLATAIFFGLVPAIRGARVEPADTLRDASGRASDGPRGRRLRSILVVSEIALSLVLLFGAGLMARSLAALLRLEPGFEPGNVLTARVSLPDRYATLANRTAFFRPLLERLRALPGVQSASMVLLRPLVDPVGWDYGFTIEGQSDADQGHNPPCNYEAVSEDYFRTMQIPVSAGRTFTESDGPDAPRVAIVSRGMAERFWPGVDPIGRRLTFGRGGGEAPWHTVVGVVGDVRYRGWTSVWVDAYVPYQQWSFGRMDLMIRSASSPAALVPALRAAVYAGDPDLPVAGVTTMDEAVRGAVAGPRFTATLLGLFAGAALLLAVVGIHGVMATSVARRTREIGVRMALGARASDVARMVLREVGAMTLVGVAVGVALALSSSRALSGLLFGVGAMDPRTLSVTALALATVAVATGLITARRATRVDPMVALRHE